MPALIKFNTFPRDVLQGIHDFSSHTFKMMLTNVAPTAANATVGDLTEISPGNGYAAGGPAVTVALTLSGGTAKVTATDKTILAAGGSIATFRYGVLYNDSSTGDRLVGYYDRGGPITLADGDSFVFDFDGAAGIITLA